MSLIGKQVSYTKKGQQLHGEVVDKVRSDAEYNGYNIDKYVIIENETNEVHIVKPKKISKIN